MDPARNFKKRNFTESLTPDPELENNQGQSRRLCHVRNESGLPLIPDVLRRRNQTTVRAKSGPMGLVAQLTPI